MIFPLHERNGITRLGDLTPTGSVLARAAAKMLLTGVYHSNERFSTAGNDNYGNHLRTPIDQDLLK
jgi:hypothetical protein